MSEYDDEYNRLSRKLMQNARYGRNTEIDEIIQTIRRRRMVEVRHSKHLERLYGKKSKKQFKLPKITTEELSVL